MIKERHCKTDFAVLDLRLPGMNGLEPQRRLGLTDKAFQSSQGDDEARAEAVVAGAIAFLKKPFKEEVLLAAIDSALKRKVGRPSTGS